MRAQDEQSAMDFFVRHTTSWFLLFAMSDGTAPDFGPSSQGFVTATGIQIPDIRETQSRSSYKNGPTFVEHLLAWKQSFDQYDKRGSHASTRKFRTSCSQLVRAAFTACRALAGKSGAHVKITVHQVGNVKQMIQ